MSCEPIFDQLVSERLALIDAPTIPIPIVPTVPPPPARPSPRPRQPAE